MALKRVANPNPVLLGLVGFSVTCSVIFLSKVALVGLGGLSTALAVGLVVGLFPGRLHRFPWQHSSEQSVNMPVMFDIAQAGIKKITKDCQKLIVLCTALRALSSHQLNN